jgi:hypothetical protein
MRKSDNKAKSTAPRDKSLHIPSHFESAGAGLVNVRIKHQKKECRDGVSKMEPRKLEEPANILMHPQIISQRIESAANWRTAHSA